jgi:hypothetical protein
VSPLPSLNEIVNKPSSPFDIPWSADLILQGQSQSLESFHEQRQCIKIFESKLSLFVSAESRDVKNFIISGSQGTG